MNSLLARTYVLSTALVLAPIGCALAAENNSSKHYVFKSSTHPIPHQTFTKYGWDWGGNWYDVQDYQHFEKRAHGEKRNPYGYNK